MKRLLFHFGADAGFFSEYNNMLFTIIYCKLYGIDFVLASKDAPFAYDKGWRDYFLPFCKEFNPHYNKKFNLRYEAYINENKLDAVKRFCFDAQCLLHGIDTLTYEVFYKGRALSLDTLYNIPTLAGNAYLLEHCRTLNSKIFHFNKTTSEEVAKRCSRISLPKRYVSMHIRRGDKHIEAPHTGVSAYMEKLREFSEVKDCFVATDDHTVIKELKQNYPEYSFYTLVSGSAAGYDQRTFEKKDCNVRKQEMLDLFADITILKKAECFVGTLSSNIGMYMYMVMPDAKCHGVDYDNWKIW